MEDWKYNTTLSGCPQGGILSPLLSNLCMNRLDQYMEEEIIPGFNRGARRAEKQAYKALYKQILKYTRHHL